MDNALRKIRCTALILATLASVSCSQGPPVAGELEPFASVCDKANDGKVVATEGYLRFPESFTGTQSAVLRLYPSADYSGSPIGVQTHIGSGANQMELPPKTYSDKDLKVHLADGSVVDGSVKVHVSGKVYYPMVGQDFTCGLENPLIEKAK